MQINACSVLTAIEVEHVDDANGILMHQVRSELAYSIAALLTSNPTLVHRERDGSGAVRCIVMLTVADAYKPVKEQE